MKNIGFFLIALLFIGFISCKKNNLLENDELQSKSTITHVTDQNILSERIILVNEPVQFKGALANELNYVYKWNITPSTINGQTLSASAVENMDGAFVVGWHTRGDAVNGELTIIDWESLNIDNPIITEAFQFEGQEINDLHYGYNFEVEEAFLYAAGKAEKNFSGESTGTDQAMAFGVYFDSESYNVDFNNTETWEKYLPAYSANSIYSNYDNANDIIISTGSNGGLTVFDNSNLNDALFNMEMSTARHYDRYGRFGAFLFGNGADESILYVWDYNTPGLNYSDYVAYPIPFGITPLGKNGISLDPDMQHAHLAMGENGLVKVDLTNGNIVAHYKSGKEGLCNAVSAYSFNNYVYAAYGSEGLYILNRDTYEVIGNWDFEGSCNFVENIGPFVLLANGSTDGLIFLREE